MTNFNPHTASLDELRDWLARCDHLKDLGKPLSEMPWAEQHWDYDNCRWADAHKVHSHPPTLDGAAAAMPEGCTWTRERSGIYSSLFWKVTSDTGIFDPIRLPDTGDRITDEYRLACLARVAMKEDSK